MKMRLFTALRFPEETIQEISKVQEILKSIDPGAKYVTPVKNFHITLVFIGNVEEQEVYKLKDALKNACSKYRETVNKEITVKFNRVGTFRGGKIVWLGIEENNDLKVLSDLVREAIEDEGIPFDTKPFRAHITVARNFKGEIPKNIDFPAPVNINKAALVYSHRVNDVLTYDNLEFENLTKRS